MTTPVEFAQRFTARLNSLLTREGVAISYGSRCKALGKALGGDDALGNRLLEGTSLPDWALFSELCNVFSVQPGYFLDANPGIPESEVETVRGATGGDTIAWKAPRGKDPGAGGRSLAWLSGVSIGRNIRQTDIVVFNADNYQAPLAAMSYILEIEGQWKAKTCVRRERTAVFSDDQNPSLILPLNTLGNVDEATRSMHGITSINQIVGSMRCARDFV